MADTIAVAGQDRLKGVERDGRRSDQAALRPISAVLVVCRSLPGKGA